MACLAAGLQLVCLAGCLGGAAVGPVGVFQGLLQAVRPLEAGRNVLAKAGGEPAKGRVAGGSRLRLQGGTVGGLGQGLGRARKSFNRFCSMRENTYVF